MEPDTSAVKSTHSTEIDYLIFTSSNNSFALPAYDLIQIVDCPKHVALPSMPSHVRGALEFMGKPVMLIDMRKLLGDKSLAEDIGELVTTIRGRKQDHLNWLLKLKDAVYNDQEITVETNPHQCAFGRWYDSFKPDSVNIQHFMARFDTPHKTIHNLAVKVKELIGKGQKSAAIDLIHEAENRELTLLINLFDTFEESVRSWTYEYAIVLNSRGQQIALAVDNINCFDKFDEVIPTLPASMKISAAHLVAALGRKKNGDEVEESLIINCDNLT